MVRIWYVDFFMNVCFWDFYEFNEEFVDWFELLKCGRVIIIFIIIWSFNDFMRFCLMILLFFR